MESVNGPAAPGAAGLPGATALDVCLDLDQQPWSDLHDQAEAIETGLVTRIGLLPGGTTSGRASVALIVELPGGRVVAAETTWRLFHTAARALAASPTAAAEKQD